VPEVGLDVVTVIVTDCEARPELFAQVIVYVSVTVGDTDLVPEMLIDPDTSLLVLVAVQLVASDEDHVIVVLDPKSIEAELTDTVTLGGLGPTFEALELSPFELKPEEQF